MKTKAILLAVTTALALSVLSAQAQQSPSKKGPAKPPSKESSTSATPNGNTTSPAHIDSVKDAVLSKYVDRTVTLRGIVGHYLGTKQRYRISLDDGSSIVVVGQFPDQGGTTWDLTARVSRGRSGYELQEISKTAADGSSGGSGVKLGDPLVLVGGGLLLVAIGILVFSTMRSRANERERDFQQQLAMERQRADNERNEARARQRPEGPGGTVASSSVDRAAPRANTIVSAGSIAVVEGPHAGAKYPIQHGETRIGRDRSKGAEVVLDQDGEVSGLHGSLVLSMDNKLIYRDQSTNGSVVDGKPVHHSQTEIHNGAEIECGTTRLKVTLRVPESEARPVAPEGQISIPSIGADPRRAPTVVPATSSKAAPTAVGYGAEFEFLGGKSQGRKVAIVKAVTTLGREDRDILLEDDSVSRKHALLQAKEGRFVLLDDGSTHGTKVNGESVGADGRQLIDGDEIQLGRSPERLKFNSIQTG